MRGFLLLPILIIGCASATKLACNETEALTAGRADGARLEPPRLSYWQSCSNPAAAVLYRDGYRRAVRQAQNRAWERAVAASVQAGQFGPAPHDQIASSRAQRQKR